jgi:hypothetical protein
MDIVTLATYSEAVQAELAKVFLESEGIKCFVADSNANNLQIYGVLSMGARLQVYAEDLERARQILDQLVADKSHELDEEALMAAFEQDAAERNVPISEISDASIDPSPTCPNCGGSRLARERDLGFGLSLLTLFLLGLPLLFIKPNLKCKRCGYNHGAN